MLSSHNTHSLPNILKLLKRHILTSFISHSSEIQLPKLCWAAVWQIFYLPPCFKYGTFKAAWENLNYRIWRLEDNIFVWNGSLFFFPYNFCVGVYYSTLLVLDSAMWSTLDNRTWMGVRVHQFCLSFLYF